MVTSTDQIRRVRRSREDARVAYNRMSPWYDIIAGVYERKYALAGLQMLKTKSGEQVLEIGYGTGHVLVELAHSVGSNGRVWGIDISDNMHQIAQRRIQKEDVADHVILVQGDAIELPFGEDKFDAVFMSFTLELFDTPDIPIVLGECRRVLSSGGRICVVSLSKAGKPTLISRLYEYLHDLFPQWMDCRPIYPRQALLNAGFHIKKSKQFSMFGLLVDIVLAVNPLK